jgi:hypothetical protein
MPIPEPPPIHARRGIRVRRIATVWITLIPWFLAAAGSPSPAAAQQEYVFTIPTTLGDTTETFWLQIPDGYKPSQPRPLLIGWHQLGGDFMEMRYASAFDSVANARGWIAASPDGSTRTHWTNHATQSHVVDMIHWISERYAVDENRIYMVGASMGGAAGMVFSNNHLDPAGPMVAAAVSISGIQDCDRRFHEQGYNKSMAGAFGGTPEEVPFTYHRNSAIYFADSSESMHMNARHLPLFLTFGRGQTDSIWRAHAQDLNAVMAGFADTVVLHESRNPGHGWGCAEEGLICDFLQGFSCDRRPRRISIDADEEGSWYWSTITMRVPASFARFEGAVDPAGRSLWLSMIENVQTATLDLTSMGFSPDGRMILCNWDVREPGTAELAFREILPRPAGIRKDGAPYDRWSYDDASRVVAIEGEGFGRYEILFDPADAPGSNASGGGGGVRVWLAGRDAIRFRSGSSGGLRIALFDPSGRRLRETTPDAREGEIRLLEGLPSGIYLLEARGPGRLDRPARIKIVAVR